MYVPYQSSWGAQLSTPRITKYVTLYPLVSGQTKLGTVYSKRFRYCLHWPIAITKATSRRIGPVCNKRQRQCCDNSAMTLQNRVCNPFSSVSIDFNENRIASVIAECCKRAFPFVAVNRPLQLTIMTGLIVALSQIAAPISVFIKRHGVYRRDETCCHRV